jgi:hypothetical protein
MIGIQPVSNRRNPARHKFGAQLCSRSATAEMPCRYVCGHEMQVRQPNAEPAFMLHVFGDRGDTKNSFRHVDLDMARSTILWITSHSQTQEQMMKVMVLVKASRDSEAGVLPSQQLLTEMGKFNEELVKAGVMLAGEGLHPSSKGKRVRFSGNNRTVTDGPFAETKELVAGFWIWKVKSMEEAVQWMQRCPNPHAEDGEVEIRPLFEPEDFAPSDPSGELRAAEGRLREQVEKLR